MNKEEDIEQNVEQTDEEIADNMNQLKEHSPTETSDEQSELTELQEEVADKMEALVQQSVEYKRLRDEAVTNAKKNFYHKKLVKNNQKVASIFQGLASPEDVSLEDDVTDDEEE